MPKKLVKADYIAVIQNHFAKQNKKLTNVSKMTLPQLKETITKYEIEFNVEEILEENKEVDKKNKVEKEQQKVEQEENDKEYWEEKERKNKEWKELDDDDQDKVIDWNKTYIEIKGYLDEDCYSEPLKILEEINKY